ncbi:MAG: LytR C-terminal domain-containing protein [Gemmatimonadetes bacterium]|nr:LytR C-terminal domain-containing protein [Gemmatimonadota bacterium]
MELPHRTRRWLIAGGSLLLIAVVVLVIRATRRDHVDGHAYDIPSATNRVMVEVLNGTHRNGLARLGTRQLRARGVDVVYFGSVRDPGDDSTKILVRRGDPARAEAVRAALGVGRVSVAPDSLRRVDVTVLLGVDYAPPPDVGP